MNYQIKSIEEYKETYKYSIENPEEFWAEIANNFIWHKKWDKVLEWNFTEPKVEWYKGAKLNITENCLDRHLEKLKDKTAIIWEPNNPEEKTRNITYGELHKDVCRFANVLKNNGVKKGDRICIYMPMIPELTVAILACARIGAIHSVVFGGFSSKSIADRIVDAQCSMVITADGVYRGNKLIALKNIVDEALRNCNTIKKVIVYKRIGNNVVMNNETDVWWHDEFEKADKICAAEIMDAEDMLFILYTSGSTGKPKGVVHTIAGYMVFASYTFANVFQYESNEIFFCTADIGWVTGHTYIVYGPLLTGATCLMFEGIPTYPDAGRLWQVVEKHKVNTLYTAPTAIRSLMQAGIEFVNGKNLDTLKKLGSVGEPINEEAWHWYNTNIGKGKCPIVDTWWQTETGGIMISPLAGITPTIPSFAMLPLPGIQLAIVNTQGEELKGNDVSGDLCIKFPWPGILRTTYGNHERCRTNYFATYKNMYYTGDGCIRDINGYYRITGRADDVLKVSGHRIGTAEVENAIDLHHNVIESAVVAFPHNIKGQGIYAFVICSNETKDFEKLKSEITNLVSEEIGSFAKPERIQFVNGLPKTRSGKIMRRILRKIAVGETENLGDTTTLLDPAIVEEICKVIL